MSANNEVPVAAPQTEQKPNDKEYNFAQIRKVLEQERSEKEQLMRRVQDLERKAAPATDNDDDTYDEPYVDEKRLNKKLSKLEERFEKKLDEKAESKARSLLEAEKQNMFLKQNADFHDILSEENIRKFAEKFPDLAEPMVDLPNGWNKQKLLYQNIKALGVHRPPEDKKTVQQTIDQKRRTPYYMPTNVGNAPYSSDGDFSASGKETAYKKMQELKKNLRI